MNPFPHTHHVPDFLAEPFKRPAPSAHLSRGNGPNGVLRVLHVEDNDGQRRVLARHLATIKELDCLIVYAETEDGAIEAFKQQEFDLVILDYHLGQGTGRGCLRRLRARSPVVPVIAMSSGPAPQLKRELFGTGADAYIDKRELNSNRLSRDLRDVLSRSVAGKAPGGLLRGSSATNGSSAARRPSLRIAPPAEAESPQSTCPELGGDCGDQS